MWYLRTSLQYNKRVKWFENDEPTQLYVATDNAVFLCNSIYLVNYGHIFYCSVATLPFSAFSSKFSCFR